MEKAAVLKLLAQTSPLYVKRPLLNADAVVDWAKKAGFPTTMQPGDMHQTLVYSKEPVNWSALGIVDEPYISEGGPRSVERLGDGGAVVLRFEDELLKARWRGLHAAGATSDYESLTCHVTISWEIPEDFDLESIEPYQGPLHFGPEVFAELDPDWKAKLVEKAKNRVAKVNTEHGVVFGWAIICKIDGEDYYDLNIDREGELAGQRVPEHITEEAMLKAAVDFAATDRPGNDMHEGPDAGTHIFLMPVTTDIAKAFGIEPRITGLMVGYKPPPHILEKFRSGDYTGFSIEGWRDEIEEIAA